MNQQYIEQKSFYQHPKYNEFLVFLNSLKTDARKNPNALNLAFDVWLSQNNHSIIKKQSAELSKLIDDLNRLHRERDSFQRQASVLAEEVERLNGLFLAGFNHAVGERAEACMAIDENITVVWTEETKAAWYAAAKELMAIGDKFNASRGFIAKYNDLVSLARLQGKPVAWVVALGYDKDLRDQAVREAYQAKKISQAQAMVWLPHHKAEKGALAAIESKVSLMIENKGATANHKNLSRLEELKQAGNLHQQRIAELKAILEEAAPSTKPMRCDTRQCLAVFEQAETENVFVDAEDKSHWLGVAGSGGDMTQLQARILANRSQQGAA